MQVILHHNDEAFPLDACATTQSARLRTSCSNGERMRIRLYYSSVPLQLPKHAACENAQRIELISFESAVDVFSSVL